MRTDENAVRQIALLAHEAASDSAKWGDVVQGVARAIDATGGAIFSPQLDPDGRLLAAAWGSTADALGVYVTRWQPHDAWYRAVQEKNIFNVAGETRVDREVLPTAQLRRTAFHADFLRHYEVEGLLSLKICDDSDRAAPSTQISFFRPPGAGEFSGPERQVLSALWPHLQRAVHTYWALRKVREHGGVIEAALDELPQPAWVLRPDATIEFSNESARRLFVSVPWVRVRSGRLGAIGDLEQAALCAALNLTSIGVGQACVATIAEPHGLHRIVLRFARLAADSPYVKAWPRACALLLLELPVPDESETQWLARMVHQFHLTAAEARLLRQFVTGVTLTAAAESVGLSIHTVRSHLRSIYDKTGCRRQAELMRLFGRH